MNPTPLEQIAKFAGAEIFSGDGKVLDRKSTRLNSSHSQISYAVFCLKKKSLHDALLLGPGADGPLLHDDEHAGAQPVPAFRFPERLDLPRRSDRRAVRRIRDVVLARA